MTDNTVAEVPVWTIATEPTTLPAVMDQASLTPESLEGLRGLLAAMSEVPIATLEAHAMPAEVDRSLGIRLDGLSPLAQQLGQLVKSTPNVVSDGGEVLYRMVVPAKVAAEMGSGIVKQMSSTSGGVYSALTKGSKIAAQATFVPVTAGAGKAAAAGAAGGSAATAGAAVAGASALTIAAPLVLMAVAVGVSAHADRQRQKAIERITELLEKLQADQLADEQHRLDGCRSAITKATAILLDEGRIGASLGLSPAVLEIDTAVVKAESRLAKWEKAIAGFDKDSVELGHLSKAIPTIADPDGEFYAHVELANAAIAMKRRVLVLQAVEHAQLNAGNPFEKFVQTLKNEQREIASLDDRLRALVTRLSALQLDRSHGIRDFMFSSGDVDKLLQTTRRLRTLGESAQIPSRLPDVAIEIAQEKDGSVIVFPALAAS